MADTKAGREISIRIRLSAEEKKELDNQAWLARKTVSAYVRSALNLTPKK
jgi:predicted DNA-binding protein